MPGGRKSLYQELKIKESLAEVTPSMFKFVKDIMANGTKQEKMAIVTKLLPKIVDKALPSQIEADLEHSGSLVIRWMSDQSQSPTSQEPGQ
jgi:hypothetical protein